MLLDNLPQRPAARMPEHHAGRFVLKVEQVELAAEFAVVAFFGFFNARDVGFQFVFTGPCRAVNALQLFVVAVAAPICAGHFGQLEVL